MISRVVMDGCSRSRSGIIWFTKLRGESTAVDKDAAVSGLDSVQPIVSKGENCCDSKHSKARIIVLCCNQDVSMKLRPLVRQIEESKMFQGYQLHSTALKVFQSWLVAFDRKMATLNRNVLLLLNRCAAHTAHGLQLNNVTLMFLPANTTSIMQLLD
ncbi:hypothetical protein PR048_022317 [Dryococelus australis]|uniref:DDE-1 domain-containing protein n=1 Tax=Dryococelus australis TaxID=614101 RepID=A0ABQ9H0P0_9NEOP|nr:hypothetical protein PR048_022317 [Dryococelus australis]